LAWLLSGVWAYFSFFHFHSFIHHQHQNHLHYNFSSTIHYKMAQFFAFILVISIIFVIPLSAKWVPAEGICHFSYLKSLFCPPLGSACGELAECPTGTQCYRPDEYIFFIFTFLLCLFHTFFLKVRSTSYLPWYTCGN
jgi:hypothetical protein